MLQLQQSSAGLPSRERQLGDVGGDAPGLVAVMLLAFGRWVSLFIIVREGNKLIWRHDLPPCLVAGE
jgi:hypothetical protein